jgi:hypothetical protein
MKNITLITKSEFVNRMMAQTQQTMVSLVTITTPDMLAKSKDGTANPFRIGKGATAEITVGKVNKVNGTIMGRYERVVTNKAKKKVIAQRIAENLPPLSANELEVAAAAIPSFGESWHTPLRDNDGNPLCLSVNKRTPDDGNIYLTFILKSKGKAEYLKLNDGTGISSDALSPFLKPPSEYKNQNLDEGEEVIYLAYNIDNIVEIALDSTRYRILDNFADRSQSLRNNAWQIANEYLEGERKLKIV